MMNDDMEYIKRRFLSFCSDDWAGLWVLISYTRQAFPDLSQDEIREMTLAILHDLLEDGLIQAGRPAGRAKFTPWESKPV